MAEALSQCDRYDRGSYRRAGDARVQYFAGTAPRRNRKEFVARARRPAIADLDDQLGQGAAGSAPLRRRVLCAEPSRRYGRELIRSLTAAYPFEPAAVAENFTP